MVDAFMQFLRHERGIHIVLAGWPTSAGRITGHRSTNSDDDARPARQVSALHPAANLLSPGWSLLVLLAWPAAALAVAAVLITRRDA